MQGNAIKCNAITFRSIFHFAELLEFCDGYRERSTTWRWTAKATSGRRWPLLTRHRKCWDECNSSPSRYTHVDFRLGIVVPTVEGSHPTRAHRLPTMVLSNELPRAKRLEDERTDEKSVLRDGVHQHEILGLRLNERTTNPIRHSLLTCIYNRYRYSDWIEGRGASPTGSSASVITNTWKLVWASRR